MSERMELQISRGIELLSSLKATVARYTASEIQLARELHSRRYQLNRRVQEAAAALEASLAARTAQMEAYFASETERLSAIYKARRVRVQRLYTDRLKKMPELAEEAQRRWISEYQTRNQLAQNRLTAADAEQKRLTAQWDAIGTDFRQLLKKSRGLLSGYWGLKARLKRNPPPAESGETVPAQRLAEARNLLAAADEDADRLRSVLLVRLFAIIPLPIFFLLAAAAGGGLAWQLGLDTKADLIGGGAAAAVFAVIALVRYAGLGPGKEAAAKLVDELVGIRSILLSEGTGLAARLAEKRAEAQAEFDQTNAELQQQWEQRDSVKAQFEQEVRTKLSTQVPRIFDKIEAIFQPRIQRLATDYPGHLAWIQNEAKEQARQNAAAHEATLTELAAEEIAQWAALQAGWHEEVNPIYEAIEAMNRAADADAPPWDPLLVNAWTPPEKFAQATRFGHLTLDLAKTPNALPKDPRLALPGPAQVSVPLALTFPEHGSLLLETAEPDGGDSIGALNNIALRLLATTPPGKLSFTIIDPVGLGQSFAGLMHLSDYEESLINRRIWTQREQIEERLAELSEHIEKVIQMYLRNEYATITEYNEQAGSVAEKYLFLIVADFPANFSEVAVRRLQSIALSGPRCGIFTLIHWDKRQAAPEGFVPEDLRKNSICLRRTGPEFVLSKTQTELGATLTLDRPPEPDVVVELTQKIGQSSIDSNRVQVPFAQIAPDKLWTGDTTHELRIAVGRTGATKLQYLAIGKGTRQHALFAGKTGSGKSTLFHVIITNLALTCSPDQVEFYLIDFKKGVEFKCYATKRLPHARVVAIESDREFALSVLQRVDAELKRRGDMFRKLGVQDVAGYKRAGGTEPMPRSLLLIDEFQEFFVEDDPIAQGASLLFDRIVRQGRAFGIHVLLGSQTLGGSYSLARATLGQMVIRVALQCNEADAHLIMDENNSAPRLLSRPGEGIYNDAAGAVEGNSPFQVVWLPDDERDQWLDQVTQVATRQLGESRPSPIVFEGNAPADIQENSPLRVLLDATPNVVPAAGHCWLGAPNSIKGPTEAVFQRQSGNNMLIVGQRDEAALTMFGFSMLALAAQYPQGAVKFVLFHLEAPGSPEAAFLDQIAKGIHHEMVVVNSQTVGFAINELATDLKARTSGEISSQPAPTTFLFILGLHKFKKLRHEDDFSFSSGGAEDGPDPGAQFTEIITEGSAAGIHVIASVDTLNSVNRFMNRKALSEFEKRVVFQMSANDSASLIDSPKASNLGLHRALYYNEHEGYLETFRPYAMPEAEWLRATAEQLARHAAEWPRN